MKTYGGVDVRNLYILDLYTNLYCGIFARAAARNLQQSNCVFYAVRAEMF
jgi:hypothetical protein